MILATWNVGEDETKNKGKLDITSYNYIIKKIR